MNTPRVSGRITRRDLFGCAALGTLGLALASQSPPVAPPGRGQRQGGAAPQGAFWWQVPEHPLDVILSRPTARSITLSTLSYLDRSGYAEYGPAGGTTAQRTPAVRLPAGVATDLTIESLSPDTAYTYRLCVEGLPDVAGGFRTARPPGSPFTFAIQADSHLDEQTSPELYARTLAYIAADRPDFLIDLGDTFMVDKVVRAGLDPAALYLSQRYHLGTIGATVPLFLVVGNHDGEELVDRGIGRSLRQRYFANPLPDGFFTGGASGGTYAFEWGDVLFVALDPYPYSLGPVRTEADNWNRSLGREQYEWLAGVLTSSRAGLKLVFIHNLVGGLDRSMRGGIEAVPLFEWGGRGLDGVDRFAQMRPGWRGPIHRLLVETAVAAVFHGHDHLFARQELDGIVYQGVPQPAWAGRGNPRALAAEYGYRQGDILSSSGYLRVAVSPPEARVEYVRSILPGAERPGEADGAVAHSYAMPTRMGQ